MSQVDKLLLISQKELGTNEADHGDDKYIAWFGGFKLDVSWCAIFVSWCANKAGIPTSIIPKYASCDAGMKWFKDQDAFKARGSYKPLPGDIIFFGTPTDSTHTGIVVTSDSSKVYTIEGNTSNMVANREYSLSATKIIGYGVPKYTDRTVAIKEDTFNYTAWLKDLQNAIKVPVTGKLTEVTIKGTPTLKNGSEGTAVILLQKRLISKRYSVGRSGADGKFGNDTYDAVVKYQKEVLGFKKPDGIVDSGNKTWRSLLTK